MDMRQKIEKALQDFFDNYDEDRDNFEGAIQNCSVCGLVKNGEDWAQKQKYQCKCQQEVA